MNSPSFCVVFSGPKGLSIERSGLSCRSVICSAIQLRVWYSFMAYPLSSPVGLAVKLSTVGPTCMLLSPHFLSLTIRQHSKGVFNIVSCKCTVLKDPIQNDPVIFFFLVHCLHFHPFQEAAGVFLVTNVQAVGIFGKCCVSDFSLSQ
ncbi:Uncharacterized protein APZ42_034241 [Daphnia magna]|uniref:Uncharacterized protein n=1 Tax=Daphnia magna TaxID=35525 RepID=A0A0P6DPG8_9CRUS|nr:Uncharacterized protein APZ42_034241 [Daphnia magna]